nr:NAD(P)-dependent oxidoreductase [Nitrosomonas sp.]
MTNRQKPLVIITGASGNIGGALCESLRQKYRVIGLDVKPCEKADASINCNLTKEVSVTSAFDAVREQHGQKIAAVIHLAAYFDFTGENNPLYQQVTVEGTRRLLKALQDFDVE